MRLLRVRGRGNIGSRGSRGATRDRQGQSFNPQGVGRRVAVIIEKLPGFGFGGAQAVGFWAVEALKSEYHVAILTTDDKLSLTEANDFFGTDIRLDEVAVLVAPIPLLIKGKSQLRLLSKHFMARYCRQISSQFDLLLSTGSEMDLGVQGMQYIHYPLALTQGRSKLHAAYAFLSSILTGYSQRRMANNWTLANSNWTAQKTREAYGIPATVVYPPVPDASTLIPWTEREDGFVCIGRIAAEKNIESVLRIVKRVRKQAPAVHLHLIGGSRDKDYCRRIERLLSPESEWAFLEGILPRAEMLRLVARHKYGIHAMREEHFGIGIAEMAKSGCVVFVPRGGGQVEIVQVEDLIYESETEAVEKITRVLADEGRQIALRDQLAQHVSGFSSAHFMSDMRALVREFFARQERDRNEGRPELKVAPDLCPPTSSRP